MALHRRRFLQMASTVVGTVCVAGCQSLIQLHADVFVTNETQRVQTVTISISDAAGRETVFEKEIAVEPTTGETPRILDNPVERDADYLVEIHTERGLETSFEWSDVSGELRISIDDDSIEHAAATGSGTFTE